MTKTGYVGHGESSHRPYYSDQHMPSAREPTAVCHNNVTRITFHIKHPENTNHARHLEINFDAIFRTYPQYLLFAKIK